MKPLISFVFLLFLSCSGIDLIEDYVPPTLRITTTIEKAPVGASFKLNAFYFNNIGDRVEDASIQWTSSNPEIIFIETTGKATTKMEGTAQLTAQTVSEEGTTIEAKISISVISNVILNPDPETMIPDTEENDNTISASRTPTLDITNSISEIFEQTSYQFEVDFQGENENATPELNWSSSDDTILEVDENGLVTAITSGVATVTVSVVVSDTTILVQNYIEVIAIMMETKTSYSGNLETKSGYTLEGSFTLSETDDGLLLSLGEDYKASSTLPGLYVYLSNNLNTTQQAFEIGAVSVFSGAHSYQLPTSIGLMDYQYLLYWCKPFNVKVGEAKIYD
jgi:hypothetical protein